MGPQRVKIFMPASRSEPGAWYDKWCLGACGAAVVPWCLSTQSSAVWLPGCDLNLLKCMRRSVSPVWPASAEEDAAKSALQSTL